jgi:hypothetical protein
VSASLAASWNTIATRAAAIKNRPMRTGRSKGWAALVGFCILAIPVDTATAESRPGKQNDLRLSVGATLRKHVVLLAQPTNDGKVKLAGTAALLTARGLTMLVTAKHVVAAHSSNADTPLDQQYEIIAWMPNGSVRSKRLGDLKAKAGCEWIMHPHPDVDIAVLPLGRGTPPEIDPVFEDVLPIPASRIGRTRDVNEGVSVVYSVYQEGADIDARFAAMLRSGIVSRINPDTTFYIDSFVFPGNSGGPVFLKPNRDALSEAKLIGVVRGYLPQGAANTGLTLAMPVDFLTNILDLPEFKTASARLNAK